MRDFKQLNIKEYFQNEKDKLKTFAQEQHLSNRIKLGIIDATAEGDTANEIYIKRKVGDFTAMGWQAEVIKTTDIQQGIQRAYLAHCNCIIVQLPTAEGIRFNPMMIPPLTDCDGFNYESPCIPATPRGILDYLDDCHFNYKGKFAVVVGRSDIVGRPMVKELLNRDCTTTVIHSKTTADDKKYLLRNADLVVVAAGHPGVVTREDCPNAIVIDVGINRGENGLCGDFIESPDLTTDRVWSTPVPGGVGLLTRLALMKNCVDLTRIQIQYQAEMEAAMRRQQLLNPGPIPNENAAPAPKIIL